jgi:hypothetical protein
VSYPLEKPRFLNPNPEFDSTEVSSLHIDEPFTHLAARAIDSVTIDGHRLVAVLHFERQQDDTCHVVCATEEGTSHLFSFNPFEEGPVSHLLVDDIEKPS